MLVSIIIPVYNVQDYIIKCLDSVADQTYAGAMECLIIDDCGQDESIRLAEEFVETYQGTIDFRIIHHDYNKGLSAARNTGIRESKGDWLYFLDSDDWITSDCISQMKACVDLHSEVEIVCAGANQDHPMCHWMDYSYKPIPDFSNNREWLQKAFLSRYHLGMTAWNRLVRKQFILGNSLFFYENISHEDELWNYQIAQAVKSASFLKCNTYNYQLRPNSIMTNVDEEIIWNRLCILWDLMCHSIGQYNREVQIAGLCSFIHERTHNGFPKKYGVKIAKVLFYLSYLSPSMDISFLLFVQAAFAITRNRHYSNCKIWNKLTLRY